MPVFDQSTNDSNPKKLFDALGTFFESIPNEAKLQLQKYFEALARMSKGIYYNLYQSDLTQYFKYTEGWIELLYKKYTVYFDNTGDANFKNTLNEYLQEPGNIAASGGGAGNEVYAYRVSAYNSEGETIASDETILTGKHADLSLNNVTITWDAVANATGYKVYGRTIKNEELLGTTELLTFTDDGTDAGTGEEPKEENTALFSYLYTLPDKGIYLSIPELIEGANTTLTEGTDYEIVSTDKIRFFNSALTKKTDTVKSATYNEYLAKTGIMLSPVLAEFYLKAFGKENPKDIILNGKYLPHIKDYDALTKYEKAQAIGKHLKFFCWASSVYLRRKPTISFIEKAYGFAQDYPFSYEAGTVTDITSSRYITIVGDNTFIYDIGAGNSTSLSVDDTVERFDLLADGIALKDYYSDQATIEGIADALEEPRLVIQLTSTATGYNPDDDIVAKFKKVAIPSGLVLKT